MKQDACWNVFNFFQTFWRAFVFVITRRLGKENYFFACWWVFVLIFAFWFSGSSYALAQSGDVHWDDPIPVRDGVGDYFDAYCLFTYDVLGPDDNLYTCKQVKVHQVEDYFTSTYNPLLVARHHCWSSQYSSWTGYGMGDRTWNGLILNTKLQFSTSLPIYNPAAPCIKKSEADSPLICDINIRSIIAGAFSNKFPLDLFSGFDADTQPIVPCPSFTVEGQTFQLCYINKLTATLKYVLLLVFIISSVLSL